MENTEKNELVAEEVNVYDAGCGELQFHCLNDCFGGGAFINSDY